MNLQYAVIFKIDAWRLFKGDVEMASFSSFDLAARIARSISRTMAERGCSVELLLQDRFGELRSERFAARNRPSSSSVDAASRSEMTWFAGPGAANVH